MHHELNRRYHIYSTSIESYIGWAVGALLLILFIYGAHYYLRYRKRKSENKEHVLQQQLSTGSRITIDTAAVPAPAHVLTKRSDLDGDVQNSQANSTTNLGGNGTMITINEFANGVDDGASPTTQTISNSN
ncbi:hypothetical protein HK100_003347 [Physocladia obscura]|uniref:Uncharacterized protein n=1 Tax=Physocladia obscura TaxID=109957 RepID=A0AAD5SUI7_9FUNG|nr:hypothetical protein HK100_003347 [Physocladia obscura]